MPAYEFRLPDLGEGVAEGEVVRWLVREGDTIAEDQPLVQVMTDKATVEIPSPRAGRVTRVLVAEGRVCHVGEALVALDSAGPAEAPAPAVALERAAAPGGPAGEAAVGAAQEATAQRANGSVLATPATRRLARELHVELHGLAGSGPGGRVTADDVRRAAAPAPTPAAASPAPAPPAPLVARPDEERVPFRGLRRSIAERMSLARRTAAHYTHVDEADVTDLEATRARARAAAAARGVKLTILPFVVKAMTTALRRHPLLNSHLDEQRGEIVLHRRVHVGIATATDAGLLVPVVRDADRLTILDLAAAIERLAERARTGAASREELSGSTITVTSLGRLGGLMATPILNPPEVAIVGLHRVRRVPVVRGDAIVPRDIVNLSISLDHRVVDGHVGARFLADVITLLEDPARLLVELT
jgi:pyruvate dehydrogenase E2 component (dihydrolipoamide acetyltransferase)